MKVIETKDNFFTIAGKAGEKVVISDGKNQIVIAFVLPEDTILNCYRKKEVVPLQYEVA